MFLIFNRCLSGVPNSLRETIEMYFYKGVAKTFNHLPSVYSGL
jgi:hypothetical protein